MTSTKNPHCSASYTSKNSDGPLCQVAVRSYKFSVAVEAEKKTSKICQFVGLEYLKTIGKKNHYYNPLFLRKQVLQT